MRYEFAKRVGSILHHCGVIEFFTDEIIINLSIDKSRSQELISTTFYNRINVLHELLEERYKIDNEERQELYNSLNKIREVRNVIAHNPLVVEDPKKPETAHIMEIRRKQDDINNFEIGETLDLDDLDKILIEIEETVKKMAIIYTNT